MFAAISCSQVVSRQTRRIAVRGADDSVAVNQGSIVLANQGIELIGKFACKSLRILLPGINRLRIRFAFRISLSDILSYSSRSLE